MQAPDISPGSSVARTKTQPGKPSPLAFKAVVGAYVQCKQYGKALSHVAEMEEVYGGSTAVSVYGGLAFFPMQLTKEEEIAAAFAEIKARKVGGVGSPLAGGWVFLGGPGGGGRAVSLWGTLMWHPPFYALHNIR